MKRTETRDNTRAYKERERDKKNKQNNEKSRKHAPTPTWMPLYAY